jgi:hypothetical protein
MAESRRDRDIKATIAYNGELIAISTAIALIGQIL